MIFLSCFVSDVFPLKVGTRWVYKIEGRPFLSDININVVDKKNSYYLLRVNWSNIDGSIVIKCDVDLSIVAYSKNNIESLGDMSDFLKIPRIELLKSPVVSGMKWENSLGTFFIVDSEYKLNLGGKVLPDCIFLKIKDTSNANNHIFIKKGVGIARAVLYIDNVGKVTLSLKKFN